MTLTFDLTNDVVLKENYTFFVGDAAGQISGAEHGLYDRDTRFLSRYAWTFGDGFETLLIHPRPDHFTAHYALIEGPSQIVGVRRRLTLCAGGFRDHLELENSSLEARTLTFELSVGSDFADMFEARGWEHLERAPITLRGEGRTYALRHTALDGQSAGLTLTLSQTPQRVVEGTLVFEVELPPGAKHELKLSGTLETPHENHPGVSYEAWLDGFAPPAHPLSERHREVLQQAQKDLRALLLFTEHGPYLAAGIPWYVAAFGRDALLAASMLLPHHPGVAEGVLRYLAAHQGREFDARRAEEPGKIMHELRYGELTRLGRVPFGPYYGTVDATALFVMLLHRLYQVTGDLALVIELRPNWEAALAWLTDTADADGDGFLEFTGVTPGAGLTVQSWKDSFDSMSHRGGQLATGAIAGSEVQGYAYAAYRAAAEFYDVLGEAGAAAWQGRAEALQTAFNRDFWLDDLQTYAMALDGDKRPLEVHNSNAGQLLWTGIVPEEAAPKLVATLFSETNWTGWGVRTLGSGEVRYNPVSYHNGSVWPHDTALIAGGLARYGFHDHTGRIREALFDLAYSQHDRRLPELVAGYAREDAPPVPYPVACRPQAWDAAALLYLLTLGRA